MTESLHTLVAELQAHVTATDLAYTRNYKSGVRTYPIPFFGDLPSARVVTVGLNPSATEFEGRGWPRALDAAALTDRLRRYFDGTPHSWFARWEDALALIGASYRVDAAHLDVSPRATASAGSVPDRALFERMLIADLPWMVRFLREATSVRLLMIAGTATQRYYLNEFLRRYLPPSEARLEGSLSRPPGRGKVLYHTLVLGSRRIPTYFCSASPSDRRDPGLLAERVGHDAVLLNRWLTD
jgi:hypothetical protein